MKKVILGTGMLLSGTIGIVGVIIALFLSGGPATTGISQSDWSAVLKANGLDVAFYAFMLLFVLGLIIAALGAFRSRAK